MGLEHPAVVVVLTIVVLVALKLLLFLVLTGGDTGRIWFSIRAFFRMLRDPSLAERVRLQLEPPPPPPPPKPSGAPLRLLRLLQRDGRFLDFVLEDVAAAQDDQIAAAVREMQPHWRAVLREHLDIVPVRTESEGATVEVPP